MIKNSTIFATLFILFGLEIKAQQTDLLTKSTNKWSVGLGVGTTQFFGDLDMGDNLSSASFLQLERKIDDYYDVQAEFIIGDMIGKQLFFEKDEEIGEMFNAEFMEFDISLVINISSLFDEKMNFQDYQSKVFGRNMNLNFLAKVGAGLNMFRTKRYEIGSGDFINSYGYKWIWENNFEYAATVKEEWKNTIVESSFVLGIVMECESSKGHNLIFSVVNRIGGGDKWDAKISNKDDMFVFYSLGTTINLNK